MKKISTNTSVTISWDPPEPSDGYTNISMYAISYGILDKAGEAVTTGYTHIEFNSLGTCIARYATVYISAFYMCACVLVCN